MPGAKRLAVFGLAATLAVTAGLLPAEAGAQAGRSAQGDCVREANRRGYEVLRTGNFRQLSDGWQVEMTLRDRQGRSDDGVCTVRNNGQVGFAGYDFGGGGGPSFTCESQNGKYRECQLPIDGRARLVRRLSKASCDEGESWGQRGDRVWVDRGCRAEFEVQRGGGAVDGQYFDCRSPAGRYRECPFQGGQDVQIVKVYTGNCSRDSTWGVKPGLVWVRAGCQAQFRLTGGGGSGGMQQRAEAACLAEARRQYITVQRVIPARNQGSYWQSTVHGQLRGLSVAADCRYDPKTGSASIFITPGGGAGNDVKVKAEQACMAHAKRLGYGVVGQSAARPATNGLTVALQLKQGNQLFQASCFYETRSGQTRLDQLRPQPR
jgi:hypothetical protein